MNVQKLASMLLIGALLAPAGAMACGEGQFNMGQGLRYQAYLAPRPATVLVYSGRGESVASREALIKGLRASGHTVTAVTDANAMADALRSQHFDVLIADYADIDVAASSAQAASAPPALLPVIDRQVRNAPDFKQRFVNYVLNGASLGQYLKSINSVLPAVAK